MTSAGFLWTMLLNWATYLKSLVKTDFIKLLLKGIDGIGLSELMNVVIVFWLSVVLLAFDLCFLIELFTKYLSPYQYCPNV